MGYLVYYGVSFMRTLCLVTSAWLQLSSHININAYCKFVYNDFCEGMCVRASLQSPNFGDL